MSMNAPSRPEAPRAAVAPAIYAWGAVLVAGIALVLVAQFVLDRLADGNDAWHWVQHASLFWGGVMAGAGVLRLYQLGGRPA